MKGFAPKIETRIDPDTGLKNYALVWYGGELQSALNEIIGE